MARICCTSAPAMKMSSLPESSTSTSMSLRRASSARSASSSAPTSVVKTLARLPGTSKTSVARPPAPTWSVKALTSIPRASLVHAVDLGGEVLVDDPPLDLLRRRQLAGLEGELAGQYLPRLDALVLRELGVDRRDLVGDQLAHLGGTHQLLIGREGDVVGARPGAQRLEVRHHERRD